MGPRGGAVAEHRVRFMALCARQKLRFHTVPNAQYSTMICTSARVCVFVCTAACMKEGARALAGVRVREVLHYWGLAVLKELQQQRESLEPLHERPARRAGSEGGSGWEVRGQCHSALLTSCLPPSPCVSSLAVSFSALRCPNPQLYINPFVTGGSAQEGAEAEEESAPPAPRAAPGPTPPNPSVVPLPACVE